MLLLYSNRRYLGNKSEKLMSDLSVEEMRVQASSLSTDDLKKTLERLQREYPMKQVSLGHSVEQDEEDRKRVDMLYDNIYYMVIYKELIGRYQKQAVEAWRKFDEESEAYIEKMIIQTKEKFNNGK